MRRGVYRTVAHFSGSRLLAQIVAPFPVASGSDWPRCKAAATIRAYVKENLLDTGRAKSALKGTDPRLRRVSGQRRVAVFAGWAQLQHYIAPRQPDVSKSKMQMRNEPICRVGAIKRRFRFRRP